MGAGISAPLHKISPNCSRSGSSPYTPKDPRECLLNFSSIL